MIIIFLHNYSLEPFLHFERGSTLSSHSFDKNPHTQIYNDDSHFYNIFDKNNLAKGNAKCCISNHQKQFVSKKLLKNLDKHIKPALESTLIESPHISYLSEKKINNIHTETKENYITTHRNRDYYKPANESSLLDSPEFLYLTESKGDLNYKPPKVKHNAHCPMKCITDETFSEEELSPDLVITTNKHT